MLLSVQRWRQAAWLSLAISAAVWIWLLAGLPVYTAAMGRATPLLVWLRAVWTSSEDMGHGPFLPLVSLGVVFWRRRAIVAAIGRPDGRGLAVMLAGAAIFWAGLKTEDVRICLIPMALWAWAVPFGLWGAGAARQLVFPAAYLLLCIPIDNLVIFFTMKLRLLAAAVAVGIANGIGVPAMRIGTGIHSTAGAGFNLDIAEACSGLRSIFAMIALTAAYAFFSQKTPARKWLLFACAVPVAVIGNIVRIVAITLVAAAFGEKAATGFYHDYSGYIVFLVAILLLMELGRLIGRWRFPDRWDRWIQARARRDSTPGPSAAAPVPGSFRVREILPLVLSPLLLLGSGALVWLEPPVQLGTLSFLADDLPAEVGSWQGSRLWHCHNEQCMRVYTEADLVRRGIVPLASVRPAGARAERWIPFRDLQPRYPCPGCEHGRLFSASLGELKQLPPDTCLRRNRYESSGPGRLTVSIVISGTGRSSLHRPELCLPAQGFQMNRIRAAEVSAGSRDRMRVKCVEVERRSNETGRVIRFNFIYWFFSEKRQTSSHLTRLFWTAWDRAVHHQAARWAMVTVYSDRPAAGAETDKEMLKFAGELMPLLREKVPSGRE